MSQTLNALSVQETTSQSQNLNSNDGVTLTASDPSNLLIRIDACSRGSSPQVILSFELLPTLLAFLRQEVDERTILAAGPHDNPAPTPS
jgi:hypothetical protein